MSRKDIAIVGMALRVPGATSLDEFWDNVRSGRDCLTRPDKGTQERAGLSGRKINDPGYIPAKPLLDEFKSFDASFFGISDTQARLMDPTHRIFLECVWEAMEQSGVVPGDVHGTTGVFASVESHYYAAHLKSAKDEDPASRFPKRLGTLIDYFALRVSHALDLKGPSLTALATCSSSLMAVNLAAQSLRQGKCTTALAGGARVELPSSPAYQKGVEGMSSATGVIRPFDAGADGTIFGDGAGVLVLKLLDDAIRDGHPIQGIIRGTGFCNDGDPEDKLSFIAPAQTGQTRAIREALGEAEIDPSTIGFVECHGTGTLLGDPIEIRSMQEVYSESSEMRNDSCAIGSVKGNIGHLGPAAGVVGVIKACLAMTRNVIPPMANFSKPNPEIDWAQSPFYVPTQALDWKRNGRPKRAAVSAFGMGGANAHVVLEEYVGESEEATAVTGGQDLLVVSAKTEAALTRRLSDLAAYCEGHPETAVSDLAYTLQVGRQAMPFRTHCTVDSGTLEGCADQLRTLKPTGTHVTSGRPVVFMFPGQGSQAVGMGQGLYENEKVYREIFDYCSDFLVRELGLDLRDCVYRRDGSTLEDAEAQLAQTSVAQPALFVVEYALAKQFEAWGLRPTAMLGHSLGELVAACLGGIYSLDNGLKLVAIRSRLMQMCEPGSMLAVSMPLEELKNVLPDGLDLAAMNSNKRNVVAGPSDEIAEFAAFLKTRKVSSRELATSHAFHSRMLDPTVDEFRRQLEGFECSPPSQRVISGVTGKPFTDQQATDPEYWIEQRRKPVLFCDALALFLTEENPIFLEVGPGRALGGFVNQNDSSRDNFSSLYRPKEDLAENAHRNALETLGHVWAAGGEVAWPDRNSGRAGRLLDMPTYPFQQIHHWEDSSQAEEASAHAYPLSLYEAGWAKDDLDDLDDLEDESIAVSAMAWLVFADDQGFSDEIVERIRQTEQSVTVVRPGETYQDLGSDVYEIAPLSKDDLVSVLSKVDLGEGDGRLRVLHFWNVDGDDRPETETEAYQLGRDRGFHSLIGLIQAARETHLIDRMDVQVYADGLSQVDPLEDALYPEKGLLLGPVRVSTQEVSGLSMRCVDIPGKVYKSEDETSLDHIWREAQADSEGAITALRPKGRFSEHLFTLPEVPRSRSRLRYGGTVLITGGVGGLGLKVAENLYRSVNARLVLTSRWEAPPREEWGRYLEEDSKLGRAMRTLQPMVEAGAEIEIIQADVSSSEDMARVIAQGEGALGPIHGVVHTAGILDDGPSLQKTYESAESVFMAKVESAYVLENLFADRPLDIFVHFSSQASLRPNAGQVDYSSANAVLDRLAIRRGQRHPGLSCAMGWGAWRDAGMAWDYKTGDVNQASLFRNVTMEDLEEETHTAEHCLLETYRYLPTGDAIFQGELRQGEHWITVEHLIGGSPVVSATTVIEMFRAGFVEAFQAHDAVEISDLAFIRKFAVNDVTKYEILYLQQEEYFKVELRIQLESESDGWQTASTGRIKSIPNTPVLDGAVREELLSVRERALAPDDRGGESGGPRFTCDWVLEDRERGAAAKLALLSELSEEVSDYGLHPGIFDRCIHTLTERFTGILLPYSCERLRIYGTLTSTTLSYGYQREPGVDESLDIFMTDLEGNLLVEVEGYVAKDFESITHQRADAEEVIEYDRHVDHRMVLDTPGNFESFRIEAQTQAGLASDEIRIRVKAAGLNFRDVLSALGQLPEGDPIRDTRGSECTGTVLEVGDEVKHLGVGDPVIALSEHSFSTNVVTKGHMATLLPECLGYTDGAGVPITFLTVDYALNQAARLQAGERILIHAGAGGIGLAAIQFAQAIGAEIYATAGQDFKRDYLRSLGVEHVMDSRSLDFVDEINVLTDGEGVDVVLNALAGEFIPASMSLLRPFGRFLEIGKKDIYANTQMGLYPFRNNLSFFGIDLGQFSFVRKEELLEMFEALMIRFSSGELHPSPVREFPLKSMGKGFEYLARAEHIGKVVFTVEQNMDDNDRVEERFNARFGAGIGMREGLEVFDRLISSDEAPGQVMIAAQALDDQARMARHEAGGGQRRLVDTEYRDPETTTEELLKQIWENTLGMTKIGVDDDFGELGGDSINAIMLQVRVNETFNLDLTLAVLLSHPTIKILGKLVDDSVVEVS